MRTKYFSLILIGIFTMLAVVPLLLSSVLFGWASLGTWTNSAALTLWAFGMLFFLAFLGFGVHVHSLLVAAGNKAKDGTFSLLSVFGATRKLYWRIALFDLLMFFITIPGFIFLYYGFTSIAFFTYVGFLWLLVQATIFSKTPFLFEKHTFWKAIHLTFKETRKHPVSALYRLGGILLWTIVPIAAWLLMTWQPVPLAFILQIILNMIWLALGGVWLFPSYIASPAPIVEKIFLFIINAAYLVIVNVWLARQK